MHTHIALFRQVTETRNSLTLPYHGAVAAARLEGMLMNGFTTIMNTGGPARFAQRLVDEGIFKGPRIYPCIADGETEMRLPCPTAETPAILNWVRTNFRTGPGGPSTEDAC